MWKWRYRELCRGPGTVVVDYPYRHTKIFNSNCTTTIWKCLISRFIEDVNTRRLSFSFPELWYSLLEFSSRNIFQHLTIANWTSWNKYDKAWSSANSLFKWRFRSCRRRCCFSSLLWSMRSLYKEFALCRYHNVSKVSLEPARSGDRLAYKSSSKFSRARSAGSRNEQRRTLWKSSQGTEGTVNQKNDSQASIGALFCKAVTIMLRSTPDRVQDVQPWGHLACSQKFAVYWHWHCNANRKQSSQTVKRTDKMKIRLT